MNGQTPNIPIKVRPATRISQHDIKKALNLNMVLSQAQKVNTPKGRLFWLILALVFFMTSAVLALKIFWFDQKTFSQYQKIVPPDTQALILIKISQLNQTAPLLMPQFEQNNDYLWLKQRIDQFLFEAQISAKNDFWPLLKDEVAFMILPLNSAEKPAWGLIVQTKTEQALQAQKIIGKVEDGLRKNFGLNQSFYRQIKINSVYSFDQIDKPYYWSQAKNFFVISNNLAGAQKMIDGIIDN
jgi:hypothetical protein